jgi:AraC-like DNA-binding protein
MPHAPTLPLKDKFLPGLSVRLSRMKEVIKTTTPHGHKSYYELIYLTEGAGWHYIDFERYPVAPHTCFLIGPGQVHHWELSDIPRGYVLMVKEEFWAQHPAPVALDELPAGLALGEAGPALATVWELLEREYQQPEAPHATATLAAYLHVLLVHLWRAHPQPTGRRAGLPPLLRAYQQCVDEQYQRLHLVKEYASRLHVTPRYLNLLCQQTLGLPANRVISRRIIAEAKRLLLFTPNTVAEIAAALGFADPSYFSKFYRHQTGQAPGEYRQAIS